ncbi:hypothetical protein [Sporosarcina sp. 6E9]|uniref:hypothetical protein n=1 Tax=Sporosarcina sp. 6E9 TaxID=2819235 RepID=UPI001AC9285E|nr:hypothetical protein [Sporosarcina sp. 6E9]MBO1910062.1 hypothetical protein [Microvirga sp. 3-52]
MRKYLVLLTILSILALAACGKTEGNAGTAVDGQTNQTEDTSKGHEKAGSETDGSEAGLKLQVLKGDAEAGATLDNNELYTELNKIIQKNPDIGLENDFSLYVVNTIHDDQGNSKLVLFGINKLPVAIKNFAFDYTLGNKDNEFVWEKQRVTMAEEETGVLQPNSAVPVVLSLTHEQEELVKTLDENNQVMAIENFTFEEVE